jgi:putative flippase GtrA
MRYINHEFARFIVVGGINTVHYYFFYLLCLHFLHLHYFLSHALGFAVSLVGSFFLNTYFTYKVKPTLAKFIRFPLTQVVNTLSSTVLLFVLIEWLQINSSFAPFIAVLFTVPITFIITRRILKPS